MKKICSICGEEKDLEDFHNRKDSKDGKRSDCKKCICDRVANYKKNNEEQYNISKKKEYKKHRESYLKHSKEYREKNRERYREYFKKYKLGRKNDINFRLRNSISARIRKSLERKSNSSMELLGCDIEFYKQYLESLFQDWMSWDNYGEWHIDHIRPLVSFNLLNEEEVFQAFNYKNTQPLSAKENISKSGKWNPINL